MIRAAIIAPDSDIRYQVEQLMEPREDIHVARRLDRYPSSGEIPGFLRANAIQLIFVSVEQLEHALALIEQISDVAPAMGFLAVGRHCDLETLRPLARLGVRDFLTLPATPESVSKSLSLLLATVAKQGGSQTETPVFSFLPAKPGVGASLTALQVSHLISTEPKHKVLLADFDLNNGVMGVTLGLHDRHTIFDAAAMSTEMDEIVWPKLVSPVGNLDVLPAGHSDHSVRLEIPFFNHLIDYSKRVYQAVCIDHSGNLEQYSIESMRASSAIVLVTGADIPSTHLARQKIKLLRKLELADRIRLVLNEDNNPYGVPARELEKILGMKVSLTLPSDRSSVEDAVRQAKFVPSSCALGRRFRELARLLMGRPVEIQESGSALRNYLKVGGSVVGV